MAVIDGQLRLQLGAGDGPGGQQQAAEGSLFAQLTCKGQVYGRLDKVHALDVADGGFAIGFHSRFPFGLYRR